MCTFIQFLYLFVSLWAAIKLCVNVANFVKPYVAIHGRSTSTVPTATILVDIQTYREMAIGYSDNYTWGALIAVWKENNTMSAAPVYGYSKRSPTAFICWSNPPCIEIVCNNVELQRPTSPRIAVFPTIEVAPVVITPLPVFVFDRVNKKLYGIHDSGSRLLCNTREIAVTTKRPSADDEAYMHLHKTLCAVYSVEKNQFEGFYYFPEKNKREYYPIELVHLIETYTPVKTFTLDINSLNKHHL